MVIGGELKHSRRLVAVSSRAPGQYLDAATLAEDANIPVVVDLQRLRSDHAPALLEFEQENRAYFGRSIPDRGDDYFAHFDAKHRDLLDEQATGVCHFHVLVADDGSVIGRINLVNVVDGAADLGFRIAEKSAGQGVAQWAVRQICDLAVSEYGLTALLAQARVANLASRAVLARTGFVATGKTVLSGQPGITFVKALT
jgi:[ribosomal protein S5]-alanine N-acetyltransferase